MNVQNRFVPVGTASPRWPHIAGTNKDTLQPSLSGTVPQFSPRPGQSYRGVARFFYFVCVAFFFYFSCKFSSIFVYLFVCFCFGVCVFCFLVLFLGLVFQFSSWNLTLFSLAFLLVVRAFISRETIYDAYFSFLRKCGLPYHRVLPAGSLCLSEPPPPHPPHPHPPDPYSQLPVVLLRRDNYVVVWLEILVTLRAGPCSPPPSGLPHQQSGVWMQLASSLDVCSLLAISVWSCGSK